MSVQVLRLVLVVDVHEAEDGPSDLPLAREQDVRRAG